MASGPVIARFQAPPSALDEPVSPGSLGSPHSRKSSLLDILNPLRAPRRGFAERVSAAFAKLPPEAIKLILWRVDSEGFASLAIINRAWYQQAQDVELYAYHLSRCPSYALTNSVISGPFRRNDLFRFKTKFAAEVRRNVFAAYLKPRETLINLISLNTNSSAAFPRGEAFRFTFSPNAQTVLALSSSRIFVIDLLTDPIAVRRELKTLRRPLSASITDDGSLLAVLSTKHQANVYGLTTSGVQHLQVLVLDTPPRTIALSHEGTVLAAAYESGVEVFSLSVNALSTDRRAVRCETVQSLMFSGDGSMLVGSSQSLDEPNAVVITAPFYSENDPDLTNRELHSRMWTTQILFPNNSSTCSHAALLPGHVEGDGNWLFAFDHTLTSYRAVRTDDTRTGVVYFLTPAVSRRYSTPSPTISPTASATGDLVVAGFTSSGLCLYGIPERVDSAPDMGAVVERHERRARGRLPLTSATGIREPLMAYSPSISASTDSMEEEGVEGKVDWRQSLFVKGRHLSSIEGLTAAQWVERSDKPDIGFPGKRLAVVAPGGVNALAEELGDEAMPVDGGRISLLDFDYSPASRRPNLEITIEVGEVEPELLSEQHGNHEIELALERRRTVRQTPGVVGQRLNLGRAATEITAPVGYQSSLERGGLRNSVSQPSSPVDGVENPRGQNNLFSPSQSQFNVQRAATAAGFQRARYPPRPPLDSNQGAGNPIPGQVIFRRAGGRGEVPDESDADNWEPPPPPYSNGPRGRPVPNRLPVTPTRTVVVEASDQLPVRQPLPHPAGSTLDGMPLSPRTPVRQTMEETNAATQSSRHRSLNDTYLETVTETTNSFQPPFAAHNGSYSTPNSAIGPVSPENSLSQNRRRPASMDETGSLSLGRSPPIVLSATMNRPMTPPIIEQSPEQMPHTPSLSMSPPMEATHVTLTGSNLYHRLNLPVPPAPTEFQESNIPAYIPQALQLGQPAPPALLPRDRDREPFTVIPPTTSHIANLERRFSLSPRMPNSPNPPSTRRESNLQSRYFVTLPPTPPRVAWGDAGANEVQPYHKIRNAPHTALGIPRPETRESQRSIHASHSTPNLLAERPRYDRLERIDSLRTITSPGERARSRSHDVTQNILHPEQTQEQPQQYQQQPLPSQQSEQRQQNYYHQQRQQRRLSLQPYQQHQHPGDTAANRAEPRSTKKDKKRKKSRADQGHFEGNGGQEPPKARKGSRCVVM